MMFFGDGSDSNTSLKSPSIDSCLTGMVGIGGSGTELNFMTNGTMNGKGRESEVNKSWASGSSTYNSVLKTSCTNLKVAASQFP